jgi:hypothetical protein
MGGTLKEIKKMKDYQQPIVEVIVFTAADVFMFASGDKAEGDLDWE